MTASIEVLDPATMTDADLRGVYDVHRQIHEETFPDDPLLSPEAFMRQQRALRPPNYRRLVLARRGDRVVGSMWVGWRLAPENRHLARVDVGVAPDSRRQGLGRSLVEAAARHAAEDGRTLLQGWTSSRLPAGDEFARALGAESRSTSHENRVNLADVDREQLQAWVRAGEALPDYELVLVEPPTPPELVAAAAEITNVMNTAPRDDLDEEDETVTAEQYQQYEAQLLAGGRRSWTLFAKHLPSGKLVALTTIIWEPDQPWLVNQGDTGTLPEHRGHGLAKWIKAAMLLKVFAEIPGARSMVTGNAMSNDAMLAINRALGYTPAGSWTTWQLDTAKVL